MELLKKDSYITSKQLAFETGVSIRTVKTEIKQINELLALYDMCIESKTGIGYQMSSVGEKEIPDINYFLDDLGYDNYLKVTDSMEERVQYIACRLLYNENYIKSEVLADELFISSSTLSHDLKQVKYMLLVYNLKILSKPYKGIIISGKEKNIRNCIAYLCFKNNRVEENVFFAYGSETQEQIEGFHKTLSEIVERHHCLYPEDSLKDIAIQTFIALERIKKGRILKEDDYVCSTITSCMIKEYIHYIQEAYHISVPKVEINRLECFLDILYTAEDNEISNMEYKGILDDTFREIHMCYAYDFKHEYALTTLLTEHIKQLIKRCKNEVIIYNPLANRVLRDYLLSVDFANILARKLQDHFHFKISIDEFTYLVMYFNVTIYSSARMHDKVLYIYCPGSRAEESMIQEEVKKLFKEIVKSIKTVTKEQLASMHHTGLDIIITTLPLPSSVPPYVPYVVADMNYKMEFISNILIQLNKQVEGYFNINELFDENMFHVNQMIASKDEYFEFLFNNLCESMVMDYGEAGFLYDHTATFGQEVESHIVCIRSHNKFVLPFIHITFAKDMFYWDTNYVKLIIFINFCDSNIEFRNYVYRRLDILFSNKEKQEQVLRNLEYETFMNVINS